MRWNLIVFLLLCIQPIKGQDTIPFLLTEHNNLAFVATINEADTVILMLHTAANDLSLIRSSTDQLDGLNWQAVDGVKSWGGSGSARRSTNNTLQMGSFKWEGLDIWENEHSGPTTDGKFGLNLFKDKVVEINFDQQILIIQSELPKKSTSYQQLPIAFENGFLFIKGESHIGDAVFENRFLIHSGYSGAILFDDAFVNKSKIGDKIVITSEKELKDAYGNVLKTKNGTLPKFTMGKLALQNIAVGFFEGAIGRQKMSVMGGNLLKRFNMIIEAERKHIYLQPRS